MYSVPANTKLEIDYTEQAFFTSSFPRAIVIKSGDFIFEGFVIFFTPFILKNKFFLKNFSPKRHNLSALLPPWCLVLLKKRNSNKGANRGLTFFSILVPQYIITN